MIKHAEQGNSKKIKSFQDRNIKVKRTGTDIKQCQFCRKIIICTDKDRMESQ
jgi:hypothetical protein